MQVQRLKGFCVRLLLATSTLAWAATGCEVDLDPVPDPIPTPDAPFSGRAALVIANLGGQITTVADTGQIPGTGGALDSSHLDLQIAGLLSAEVAHASVVGQDQAVSAEASLANFQLTVAGHTITLEFLISRAMAECNELLPAVSGSSQISTLVIDGESHTVSSAPNQSIALRDLNGTQVGVVRINEQTPSIVGTVGRMTVNAVRVEVFGAADIQIAHAEAAMECGAEIGVLGDFVTGGGFITGTPSGARANFGVAGGNRNGMLSGHLTYIDHGANLRVRATSVTAYAMVNQAARRIEGTAEVSGQGVLSYVVTVADNGEPGSSDTFEIMLSNGYSAGGVLTGGNIQLHQ